MHLVGLLAKYAGTLPDSPFLQEFAKDAVALWILDMAGGRRPAFRMRDVLILTLGGAAGRVEHVGSQRSSAVEQCFRKAKVAGSIPAAGSILNYFCNNGLGASGRD